MPNVHGKGDYGVTKTLDGKLVEKDDNIIVASGKLDTLLSSLYFARYYNHEKYAPIFDKIEGHLTHLSIEISWNTKLIELDAVFYLENGIANIKSPDDFVNFTRPESMWLNECRVRCREAEIAMTPLYRNGRVSQPAYSYINRLSLYFFLLAYEVENKI